MPHLPTPRCTHLSQNLSPFPVRVASPRGKFRCCGAEVGCAYHAQKVLCFECAPWQHKPEGKAQPWGICTPFGTDLGEIKHIFLPACASVSSLVQWKQSFVFLLQAALGMADHTACAARLPLNCTPFWRRDDIHGLFSSSGLINGVLVGDLHVARGLGDL